MLKRSAAKAMALFILFQSACSTIPPPKAETSPERSVPSSAAFVKPALVLMPVRLSGDIPSSRKDSFETALLEQLRKYYEVYAGKRVYDKVDEVFRKRSEEAKEGQHCDDSKCLQDIAIEFQTELVAVATVEKAEGGYFITLNIVNIFEDKPVYSKSEPCEKCSQFEIVERIKQVASGSALYVAEYAGNPVNPAPPPIQEGSSWWKWALGILLVGGVAAAGGSGGGSSGGGGGSSGTATAPATVSW